MSNRIERAVESFLSSVLSNYANQIAEQAKANARSNPATAKDIPEAISVGKIYKKPGGVAISINVDLDKALQAAAYEYGSGIHSMSNPGTYVIAPRNKDALAFNWVGGPAPNEMRRGRKFIGIGDDGRYLFNFIEHPGVVARPYLRPALNSKISGLREAVKVGMVKAVLSVEPRIVFIRSSTILQGD